MSFTQNTFVKLDAGFNYGNVQGIWGYNGANSVADIQAPAYFPTTANIGIGDIIFVWGADGNIMLYATAISPVVTTAGYIAATDGMVANQTVPITAAITTQTIAIPGLVPADIAQATSRVADTNDVLISVLPDMDAVHVTYSGTTGTGGSFNLSVFRN